MGYVVFSLGGVLGMCFIGGVFEEWVGVFVSVRIVVCCCMCVCVCVIVLHAL